jgi:hypothetical protein
MFDANYKVRLLAAALIDAQFESHLADVCSERGIRVQSPRKVYTEVIPTEDRNISDLYYLEIRQPEGRVSVNDSDTVTTEADLWILGTVTAGSMEQVDREAMAYLSALGRTFAFGKGQNPTYAYELAEFSTSPPVPDNGTNRQTVGVRVSFLVIE